MFLITNDKKPMGYRELLIRNTFPLSYINDLLFLECS